MNENIVWHTHHVSKGERTKLTKQRPCILWFTGLSGSGKSTIANALDSKLYAMGNYSYLLDGDNIRHGLNKDLGFDEASRIENIRRIGEVSKLFVDAGLIVVSAFISPFQVDRDSVRALVPEGEFIEVYIDAPLSLCEQRDPKGLYEKARAGKIAHFTGISSPYEAPISPEIHIQTETIGIEDAVNMILNYLSSKGYFNV